MKRPNGFTLVEMLTVIAIVAILAAVAVPNFISYLPRHRLQGAARKIMVDLLEARMQAVNLNRSIRVSFSSDGTYTFSEVGSGQLHGTKNIRAIYNDVSFDMANTHNPVFQARGVCSPTGSVKLQNGAGARRVIVNIAGRVRIE